MWRTENYWELNNDEKFLGLILLLMVSLSAPVGNFAGFYWTLMNKTHLKTILNFSKEILIYFFNEENIKKHLKRSYNFLCDVFEIKFSVLFQCFIIVLQFIQRFCIEFNENNINSNSNFQLGVINISWIFLPL